MNRFCNLIWHFMVRNADEKGRGEIERALTTETARLFVALREPPIKRQVEQVRTRFRKIAPPGFDPESIEAERQRTIAMLGGT